MPVEDVLEQLLHYQIHLEVLLTLEFCILPIAKDTQIEFGIEYTGKELPR